MTPKSSPDIIQEIYDYLSFLKDMGASGFECSAKTLGTLLSWEKPVITADDNLDGIKADLLNCQRCKLHKTRQHIVFGSGNPNARLVFIGEAPGGDEDRQGEPFVGAAGRLLTKIIEAIQLSRDQVYICNIIKCRPPNNRNPESDEIGACFGFLKRQLDAVKPEFICTLGKFAAQVLLKTEVPISKLRGRFYDYNGIRLLPTYHPAFLLRNPEQKRDVWEDMKLLMKAMGIALPQN